MCAALGVGVESRPPPQGGAVRQVPCPAPHLKVLAVLPAEALARLLKLGVQQDVCTCARTQGRAPCGHHRGAQPRQAVEACDGGGERSGSAGVWAAAAKLRERFTTASLGTALRRPGRCSPSRPPHTNPSLPESAPTIWSNLRASASCPSPWLTMSMSSSSPSCACVTTSCGQLSLLAGLCAPVPVCVR